jgi:hypothetical protein
MFDLVCDVSSALASLCVDAPEHVDGCGGLNCTILALSGCAGSVKLCWVGQVVRVSSCGWAVVICLLAAFVVERQRTATFGVRLGLEKKVAMHFYLLWSHLTYLGEC